MSSCKYREAEKQFWGEFLELYKSMPCLWKIKSSDYSNRELKSQCYKKMIEKLKEIDPDANREKVVKKINVFRTNYKRDLKKVTKSTRAKDKFESSLWYFDKLRFLEKQECSTKGKYTESVNVGSDDETLEKPRTKKRRVTAEDNLLKMACQKLTNSVDDAKSVLAKGWGSQYEELSKAQKLFTRTIVADVLYHGCLDKLTEKTVEDIHEVLKGVSAQSYTPYIDDYSQHSSQSCSSSVEDSEEPL